MNKQQAITASGINVLAGLWLIISPFVLGYTGAFARHDIIIGVIIGILALIRFLAPEGFVWMSWVNIIMGLWLIIAPFTFRFVSGAALWNDVILGIIVTSMAIWSSSATVHQKGV